MKKILSLIFLMIISAALFFGQAVGAEAQQEWKDFCDELNRAAQRFCFIAAW